MGELRLLGVAGASVLALGLVVGFAPLLEASDGSVAMVVVVEDPIDGWLGGQPDLEGDLVLAQTIAGEKAVVTRVDDALQFEVPRDGILSRADELRSIVVAFHGARSDLRAGLDIRLDMVPELAAYANRRSNAIRGEVDLIEDRLEARTAGSAPEMRAARAAAIAEAESFEDRGSVLLGYAGTTLAAAWTTTPVSFRLDRIDQLLSEAFWFAAGETN